MSETSQDKREMNSLSEEDALRIVSSMRQPIEADKRERFFGGDLTAVKIHCVDGRPDKNPREACIRRFGGPFGLMVNVLGAVREVKGLVGHDITPNDRKVIVRIVRDRLGVDGTLYHSDDHHHDHSGCGYVHSVMTNPEAFGLTEEDCHYFEMLLLVMQRIDVVGSHNELAVLIVHTDELIQKDPEKQFFVLNAYLDDFILGQLCPDVASELSLDTKALLNVAIDRRNKNAQATMLSLKIEEKGIPTFEIHPTMVN